MLGPVKNLLERADRVRRDPARLVDYLRQPRFLVVGTPTMNRLGLQALRATKEHLAWRMRRVDVPEEARPILETLDRDGFAVIENFLPDPDFAEVSAEVDAIDRQDDSQFRIAPFGENFRSRLMIVSKRPAEYPALMRNFRDNPLLLGLASAVARRPPSYRPNVIAQWVYKPEPHLPHEDFDYNSYLHADRHYPFLKAFYYPRDVSEGCAPYTFVRGSHLFNWERLRFEYRQGVHLSITRKETTNETLFRPEQKESDRRLHAIAEELVTRRGLEIVRIAGKRNTLILSNNAGLHCRAPLTDPGPRATLNLDYKYLESWAHRLYPILRNFSAGQA